MSVESIFRKECRDLEPSMDNLDVPGRVHNWRNHLPDSLADEWHALPRDVKMAAIIVAQLAADREEWD